MKVTQKIQLDDKERLAIQKVLEICDEISDIAHCTMMDVFAYLESEANIIGNYKYSVGDTLDIAEIG